MTLEPMNDEERAKLRRHALVWGLVSIPCWAFVPAAVVVQRADAADLTGDPYTSVALKVIVWVFALLALGFSVHWVRLLRDLSAGVIATSTPLVVDRQQSSGRGYVGGGRYRRQPRAYSITVDPPLPSRRIVVNEWQFHEAVHGHLVVIRYYPLSGVVYDLRRGGPPPAP